MDQVDNQESGMQAAHHCTQQLWLCIAMQHRQKPSCWPVGMPRSFNLLNVYMANVFLTSETFERRLNENSGRKRYKTCAKF